MRILLISHTCRSRTEGQPKARRLAGLPGVEMRVLIPDRWRHYGTWRRAETDAEDEPLFQVGRVALPWAGPAQWYLHWYPCLKRLMREFQPDVIDLWEEPWGLVSAHACRLRNRLLPGAKIVSETEQNINKRLPFPFERFRSYTLRNADFAVGRNAEAIEHLRSKGYGGPAEVVPNAVDAELFRPMNRETCRAELGLPDAAFLVGYAGRLVEEKGLTDILDALALCPPDTHAVFLGSGPLQPELERRAESLGLADRLRILQGQPLDRVPLIMNALDVFLLPSRTTERWKEQFGRVIIEAHACELPVIGSDSGAIPEVVGQAGLITPERDPEALADAIQELRANPDLRSQFGRAGRRQVEAHYTWQRVAERMHAIYHRVLGQAPAPTPDAAMSQARC